MAEVKGVMLICDRCSNSVFLKTIGDGEADGGVQDAAGEGNSILPRVHGLPGERDVQPEPGPAEPEEPGGYRIRQGRQRTGRIFRQRDGGPAGEVHEAEEGQG